MSTSRRQIRGILFYALGVGAFATMDAFARHLSRGYPIVEIVLLRAVLGYLPILVQYQLGTTRGRRAVRSQAPGLQLLRGGLMLAASATFFLSLTQLSLADATAISLIAPLLMVLFGVHVLREPSSREMYVAIAIALVGGLLIVRPYADSLSLCAVAALASAVFYALAAVATRRLGQSDPSIVTALWGNTTMLVAAAALVIPTGWVWPTADDWWPILGMGLAGGVANILYIAGLRMSRVSEVAVIDYTIFAWAAAFSVLVFQESLSTAGLIGAGLIVASGAHAALVKWRRSAGQLAPARPRRIPVRRLRASAP
jgi:drug/metabolite transporter (DMT)-like permease